jgi:HSP20 family molecular chaperone IbpA
MQFYEPVPEVHRVEHVAMAGAGLPGATEESIHLTVAGDHLIIDADGIVESVSYTGRTSPG